MIEEEMRAVLAAHARECGVRAEQMMVNNHLYPDEIAAWAEEVERLRAVERAARAVVDEWGARDEDWYRPVFEDEMDALRAALGEG